LLHSGRDIQRNGTGRVRWGGIRREKPHLSPYDLGETVTNGSEQKRKKQTIKIGGLLVGGGGKSSVRRNKKGKGKKKADDTGDDFIGLSFEPGSK